MVGVEGGGAVHEGKFQGAHRCTTLRGSHALNTKRSTQAAPKIMKVLRATYLKQTNKVRELFSHQKIR